MNSIRLSLHSFAATGLLLVAGCQQAVVPTRSPVGASSYQFIDPPVARPPARPSSLPLEEPGEGQETLMKVKAKPVLPLANPSYPSSVLGRVRMPVTVGVRISIDETGRVGQIGESLAAFSSGGEFTGEFRAAVEDALAQWRFRPAELCHLVLRGGRLGQGGYWLATRREPADDAFDVCFTFTAKGDVLAGGLR